MLHIPLARYPIIHLVLATTDHCPSVLISRRAFHLDSVLVASGLSVSSGSRVFQGSVPWTIGHIL